MLRLLITLVLSVTVMTGARAEFPERAIRIMVAFAPGSSTDTVARLLGERLSQALGQPVVIENKPGAGGNIATTAVMNSNPDGYTLLFHSVAYAVNPSLFANAGYDALNDLQAVAMAGVTPNLIYVHPDVKATSLPELLTLAKTSNLSYASSGNGTTTHLGAEWLFRGLAKVDITHVPFQPAAATMAVSAQVPIASTSMPPAVPFIKSGKVRPLAVMSGKRSAALPDVPTVAELGFRDFEAHTWFALFAPAKTPAPVLDLLNAEINKALASAAVRERFEALSLETQPMDRAALRRYVESEVLKWGRLVKDFAIKVQ
jgi:tripartite-type tricarboxylate transporter receptor subunit TctC